MNRIKQAIALEIKNADRGEVGAVVARFNNVDRDGDVLLPGAIRDGSPVLMSGFGHDTIINAAAPVGRGRIRVVGDEARFDGKVFGTDRGRETFQILKETRDMMQWSFGFHVEQAGPPPAEWREKGAVRALVALDTFEVSPVARGAGIGTGTVSVKCVDCLQPAAPAEPETPQWVLAQFARRAKAGGPHGAPLPERFRPYAKWVARELGLRDVPLIQMLSPVELDGRGAGGKVLGAYSAAWNRIFIRDDPATFATIRRVLAHEMVHAATSKTGEEASESYCDVVAAHLERRAREANI